jgi:hypothetical protein
MNTPTVVLVAVLVVILALVGIEWPEIRRYLKMRSM